MAWRLAGSLITMRDQINRDYPGRSKGSDGTLGDAAHSARKSDHNPDRGGVVRAADFTHSPAKGFNSYAFAEHLRQTRDPRVKYVISNGRIFSGNGGPSPWVWRKYSGANPHDQHVHVSVNPGASGDATWAWLMPSEVAGMQAKIGATVDGAFGDQTRNLLIEWQRRQGLDADGIVGPATRKVLAATSKPKPEPPLDLPVTRVDYGAHVIPPQVITPGGRLTSPDGKFGFVLQGDGNAVIYGPGGRAVWQTGVRGDRLAVQADGNLVLYRGDKAVWSTGTERKTVTRLSLGVDGILRLDGVAGALWQSSGSSAALKGPRPL